MNNIVGALGIVVALASGLVLARNLNRPSPPPPIETARKDVTPVVRELEAEILRSETRLKELRTRPAPVVPGPPREEQFEKLAKGMDPQDRNIARMMLLNPKDLEKLLVAAHTENVRKTLAGIHKSLNLPESEEAALIEAVVEGSSQVALLEARCLTIEKLQATPLGEIRERLAAEASALSEKFFQGLADRYGSVASLAISQKLAEEFNHPVRQLAMGDFKPALKECFPDRAFPLWLLEPARSVEECAALKGKLQELAPRVPEAQRAAYLAQVDRVIKQSEERRILITSIIDIAGQLK